jgi:hypothetical protein
VSLRQWFKVAFHYSDEKVGHMTQRLDVDSQGSKSSISVFHDARGIIHVLSHLVLRSITYQPLSL